MTIQAQHKELIELSVKRSPHFKGNEGLFDAFCDEVYSRIKDTLAVLGDKLPPQTYLDKITQKSILHVLKDKKRLGSGIRDGEAPIENSLSFNINEKGDMVFEIPYPNSERERASVIHEQLKILINKLYRINEHEPEKQYLKLFDLRYNKNLSVSDLAYKLEITEPQVSQRLFELLAKLNEY
jgi:RNA polymerase sigma factor (sigma-70 family)